MKNRILHRLISLVFIIIFVIPSVAQSIHALNHESHELCDAKEIKHIHKKQIDCKVFHITIHKTLLLVEINVDLAITQDVKKQLVATYTTVNIFYQHFRSPRAPPCFIA